MKKLTVVFFGVALAALQTAALAGPNWNVIHEAEAHRLANQTEQHALPLDHGPRALSTPWLNKVHEDEARMAAHTKHPAHHHMVAANTATPSVTARN